MGRDGPGDALTCMHARSGKIRLMGLRRGEGGAGGSGVGGVWW